MLLPWIAVNQRRGAVGNTKEALPLAAYSGTDKMENKDNAHHDGTNSQYRSQNVRLETAKASWSKCDCCSKSKCLP